MLTDEQGLRLVEALRSATASAEVRALCEWMAELAQQRVVDAAVAAARRADRRARHNERSRVNMRRWRARRAAQKRLAADARRAAL
jgi:hypothetical protein